MNALVATLLAAAFFVPLSSDKGVQVEQRLDTHFVELRSDGALGAPPRRVLAALLDYEPHPALAKEVVESRVLARGDHVLDVYQRLKMPVVADRDYTLRVTWGSDGDVLWLRFRTANELGPAEKDGVQRMALHEGEWRLTPAAGNTTEARYAVRLDLGGSVKAWMARSSAGDAVTDLYERLRKELRETPRDAQTSAIDPPMR